MIYHFHQQNLLRKAAKQRIIHTITIKIRLDSNKAHRIGWNKKMNFCILLAAKQKEITTRRFGKETKQNNHNLNSKRFFGKKLCGKMCNLLPHTDQNLNYEPLSVGFFYYAV